MDNNMEKIEMMDNREEKCMCSYHKGYMSMFILIILIGLSFPSSTGMEQLFSNWLTAVAVVLIFVLSVLVILFLVSRLISSAELEAIAKTELMQLLATAIIIAFLYAGIKGAEGISADWFGHGYSNTTSLYNITMTQINNVSNLTNAYMNKLYGYNDYVSEQASKSGSAYFWGVGYTDSSCSALNSATAMLNTGIQVLTLAAFDITAVKLLIIMGVKYLFPFFLTLGVLLRSFAFTRRWGGVLIAIAIAFYPILPMTYSFFDITVQDFITSQGYTGPEDIHYDNRICFQYDTQYVWDILPTIKDVTNRGMVENVMAVVLLRIVLVTTVILFAVMSFIGAVAGSIGSQIDLSPLIRLI